MVASSQALFHYIEQGIEAQGHTPVYKMHKYFARRPHNVFRSLIEAYTRPGDIVLDCFCGGGVTLFEGLASGRKVVAVDVNPLATFISDCQTTVVPLDAYRKITGEVLADVQHLTDQFYTTQCRECGERVSVRWYELAYRVVCGACGRETTLSNEHKRTSDDKVVNGQYRCQHCASVFTAVDAPRSGYDLLSVTYRCQHGAGRQTVPPTEHDIALMQTFEQNFEELIKKHALWYPQDEIPASWDRQQEDCLHRKSIHRFADLFTRRSLFFNAYLLKRFQQYRESVSPDVYKMLLFTFSAIIRYTNNMTFSTGNWMDGRPIAWAKHAYWIPNQFVEVNPLEYVEKRRSAILSGLRYQQQHLKRATRAQDFSQLENGEGTHIVWTADANRLELPDGSVDAIITDPPYGSNVQYGELSHYWLVWLRHELGLDDALFHLGDEIVVNRKTQSPARKSYADYFQGLKDVFAEGYRVLKPGGVLCFTFNNKDMKAWYAVTRAAIEAGFLLKPEGIIYQEPIEHYRNTAHTRYAGSLHGDFIYTFRKPDRMTEQEPSATLPEADWHTGLQTSLQEEIRKTVEAYLRQRGSATTNELSVAVMAMIIPLMVKTAQTDEEFVALNSVLEIDGLDGLLSRFCVLSADRKTWQLRSAPVAREEA